MAAGEPVSSVCTAAWEFKVGAGAGTGFLSLGPADARSGEVDDKPNGIAAMRKLLEMLALEGRIVTANAMHTQRVTAEAITAGAGTMFWRIRPIRVSLHDDVRLYLDDPAGRRTCNPVSRLTAITGASSRAAPLSAVRSHGCGSAMTGRVWPPSARSR